jgi:hypothetical protein
MKYLETCQIGDTVKQNVEGDIQQAPGEKSALPICPRAETSYRLEVGLRYAVGRT